MENFNLKKFLVENKLTYNSRLLNEDNLEVKSIAKQIYSFLKQNGVNTKLVAQIQSADYGKKIGATLKQEQNEALISYYDDPKTKQTIIEIQLFGGPTSEDLVLQTEKKLLSSFPKLEQYNREAYPAPQYFVVRFRLKEKTTAKGGLAGNTQQNAKPAAQ